MHKSSLKYYRQLLVIDTPGTKIFGTVACLRDKTFMLQRAEIKKGGLSLPLAFQYLIVMTFQTQLLILDCCVLLSSFLQICQLSIFPEILKPSVLYY